MYGNDETFGLILFAEKVWFLGMQVFQFDATVPLQYNLSGKFISPNAEWVHLTRRLYDFELFIVTEGTLYIAAEETEYCVETGGFLLMPPTSKQYGYRPGGCSFYWLHFSPMTSYDIIASEREGLVADTGALLVPLYGKVPSMERMVILFKQLQDSERRYGMRTLSNYHTSAVVAELAAQCFGVRKHVNADNSPQLYNDIVEYLSLNPYGEGKVTDVAAHFGYNEKYLTTYFKKWAKVSMKQYMLQQKMERAKAELGETNYSVAQIGYMVGYSDPHNFTNAFKKVTGLTPSEYRGSYSKRSWNQ